MKRTTGVPQHNWRHSPARGMVIGDREVEPSLLTQRAHSDGEAAVDPSLHLYDRGTEIFGALSLRLRPRHPRRVRRTGGAQGNLREARNRRKAESHAHRRRLAVCAVCCWGNLELRVGGRSKLRPNPHLLFVYPLHAEGRLREKTTTT